MNLISNLKNKHTAKKEAATLSGSMTPGTYGHFPSTFQLKYHSSSHRTGTQDLFIQPIKEGSEPSQLVLAHKSTGDRLLTLHSGLDDSSPVVGFVGDVKSFTRHTTYPTTIPASSGLGSNVETIEVEDRRGMFGKSGGYTYSLDDQTFSWRPQGEQHVLHDPKEPVNLELRRQPDGEGGGEVVATWTAAEGERGERNQWILVPEGRFEFVGGTLEGRAALMAVLSWLVVVVGEKIVFKRRDIAALNVAGQGGVLGGGVALGA